MVPWSLTPFSPCIYTLRRVSFRAPVNVATSGRDARAWVEVDLAAVVENARTVGRVAGTRLLPVVRATAYGVGAVAVSQALETLGPWGYGVAAIEEGAELRAAGITRPVLVFTPARDDLFDGYRERQLTPALGDGRTVADWIARGARGGAFHLEIDTGMGRSGVRWDEVEPLADLLDTPYLEGCYTQFHSADRGMARPTRSSPAFRRPQGASPAGPRCCTWPTAPPPCAASRSPSTRSVPASTCMAGLRARGCRSANRW